MSEATAALIRQLALLKRANSLGVLEEVSEHVALLYHEESITLREVRERLAPSDAISATTIWRLIGVRNLFHRLPWVREAGHLEPTHFYTVLQVATARQEHPLRVAEA